MNALSATTSASPFVIEARTAKAACLIIALLEDPASPYGNHPDPDEMAALSKRSRSALARRASTYLGRHVNRPSPETMAVVSEGLRRIYAGTMSV